ncbi:hypothetical protein OBBRIDRAFT_762123 [Obba rivulosa]|uniref:MYND-type domain-containing protein n=1 Tax=Obba rivulosa TaxID=1052685 RepID=A0A8E2AQ59_9APHY|nr:hypothetical protein OBBRIDRAFT_762123 [Obba rivulosa]
MPGPRAKGKTGKPKPSASTQKIPQRSVSNTFASGIENAEGWNAVVNMLCDYFELPDLITRSGLKKVHSQFADIYKKLDRAYATNRDNPKVLGGVVGIWAKMSADALLRDKMFKEGLLARMIPLLDIPFTRHVALQALSTVTHHGGFEARRDIAREAPRLIRLIEEHADDSKLVELCIVTLAHSVGTTVGGNDKFDLKIIKPSEMRHLLKVTTQRIQKPTASHYMIDHALTLFSCTTLRFAKECKETPSMLSFLVACLRSNNIVARVSAITALISLNSSEAEIDRGEMDPRKLMATAGGQWPDNLVDELMDYGFTRCETILTLSTMRDYQSAMMDVLRTHDLYSLGRTLAGFITRTEYSINDGGAYSSQDPRTGRVQVEDVGLPFVRWGDALPHCAKALRAKGAPADLDAADILEIKYHIMKRRIQDAIQVGRATIDRNPQLAYAYYPLGLGGNSELGLRGTKKGLKCKQITPFVRHHMLQRAVEHAGTLGINVLPQARAGDKDYAEGIAFLQSAYEDAKAYIASAPPDARQMGFVLDWLVILTLVIRGPEVDPDLKELKPILDKIDFADQCAKFLGGSPKRTLMRLTRELILQQYLDAVKEWTETIERFDALGSSAQPAVDADKAEDDLAAWLEKLHVDDGEARAPSHCMHPRISTNSVELYRCSWCKNPSAVLRKCGSCGKTRYCDAACQKAHWGEHKVTCKSS